MGYAYFPTLFGLGILVYPFLRLSFFSLGTCGTHVAEPGLNPIVSSSEESSMSLFTRSSNSQFLSVLPPGVDSKVWLLFVVCLRLYEWLGFSSSGISSKSWALPSKSCSVNLALPRSRFHRCCCIFSRRSHS